MSFDSAFAINTICPAANAAYLMMTVPNPALPPGYALVGAIEADTHHAVPAMAQSAPGQTRMVNGMLSESNIFGLVAWNAVEQTALVAFRGTKSIWEWIADIDAVPVPYLPVGGTGLVHMGFALVYEHIRPSVAKLLLTGCVGAKRILVTGHSLGGAVAVLAALDILKNVPLGVVPELWTLAGPRAGDLLFCQHYNSQIPITHRIVNFMDVVPQVPLPPFFAHVGAEAIVHGGFRPLDVAYAHHLTTYLSGLQNLTAAPPPVIAAAAMAAPLAP